MISSDERRRALLYIAGRFMAVRIDLCGKRKRASAQGSKGASDQAMSKRSSSGQDSSSQARKLSSPQAHKSRIADPG